MPHGSAVKSPAGEEEERRLAYVAITRARRHLVISWALRRRIGKAGREAIREPSRFLDLLEPPRPGTGTGAGPGRRQATPAPKPARRSRALASAPVVTPETDTPLVAALKDWRRQRARDQGVPAYVVLDDATIGQVAAVRPRTEAALSRVRGIGPKRVELYGAEILELVRAHD